LVEVNILNQKDDDENVFGEFEEDNLKKLIIYLKKDHSI